MTKASRRGTGLVAGWAVAAALALVGAPALAAPTAAQVIDQARAADRQGRHEQALRDYYQYLELRPDAPDAATVQKRIDALEAAAKAAASVRITEEDLRDPGGVAPGDQGAIVITEGDPDMKAARQQSAREERERQAAYDASIGIRPNDPEAVKDLKRRMAAQFEALNARLDRLEAASNQQYLALRERQNLMLNAMDSQVRDLVARLERERLVPLPVPVPTGNTTVIIRDRRR